MSRKLVTGSKTDVQFDKLDGTYDFGLATFDNAQVRHAYNMGALHLKFASSNDAFRWSRMGGPIEPPHYFVAPSIAIPRDRRHDQS